MPFLQCGKKSILVGAENILAEVGCSLLVQMYFFVVKKRTEFLYVDFFCFLCILFGKGAGQNAQRSPLAKTKKTKVATLHAPHSKMVPTAMPCAFDGSNIG